MNLMTLPIEFSEKLEEITERKPSPRTSSDCCFVLPLAYITYNNSFNVDD